MWLVGDKAVARTPHLYRRRRTFVQTAQVYTNDRAYAVCEVGVWVGEGEM